MFQSPWKGTSKSGAQAASAAFRSVHEVTPERARVTPGESRGRVTRTGRLTGISGTDLVAGPLRPEAVIPKMTAACSGSML